MIKPILKNNINSPGIYQIESFKTGKKYIGSTVNISNRICGHHNNLSKGAHINKYLQNHVNKYGINDLLFYVVEFCPKEKLLEREQYYIDTRRPEFNIAKVAGNTLGVIHSEEAKRKMSESNKGIPKSEEHKKKISESHQRHFASPEGKETRRKMSEALKGRTFSEETRMKISEAKKGKSYHNKKLKNVLNEILY